MKKIAYLSAAIFGFLGVALGAFGAHALEDLLTANDHIDTWHTAVIYQFVHAGLLLVLGLIAERNPSKTLDLAVYFTIVGILIFSGTLYVLSVTNVKVLGAFTPIGGVCFLAAWACLFIHFLKTKNSNP